MHFESESSEVIIDYFASEGQLIARDEWERSVIDVEALEYCEFFQLG